MNNSAKKIELNSLLIFGVPNPYNKRKSLFMKGDLYRCKVLES